MLPLGGAFAEPAVVREVQEEIQIGADVFAPQVWEQILEADQDRGGNAQCVEMERHRRFARRKFAIDLSEVFQERQIAG